MDTIPHLRSVASCVAAALALAPPIASAADRTVTNCLNMGAGSLRAAVAAAASGDRIVFDTATMNCSAITLTSGQISVDVDELTLQGPTQSVLTIGGFNASRVLFHNRANNAARLTINNLTIQNGKFESAAPYGLLLGGCIYSSGDVVLSGTTVTGCVVRNLIADSGHAAGGGLASYKLHMQNSVISNNVAQGGSGANPGGGVFVQDETVIRSSTISGNASMGPGGTGFSSGGGLASQSFFGGIGGILIESSTISGNESDFGGGIAVFYGATGRTVRIERSEISGNKARAYGGGVGIFNPSYASPTLTTTIVNSTISGNRSYGTVGGIFNQGYLTVSNSTIAFNRADSDVYQVTYHLAAGLCTTYAATLQSTIIANNTLGAMTGSDLNGPFAPVLTGSNNLVMVTLAGTTAPLGTLTGDPMLAGLIDNGGPTQTHALLMGSPAFGAGNNVAQLASDQRGPGFARSTNGKTDIGAWQSGDGIFFGGFD